MLPHSQIVRKHTKSNINPHTKRHQETDTQMQLKKENDKCLCTTHDQENTHIDAQSQRDKHTHTLRRQMYPWDPWWNRPAGEWHAWSDLLLVKGQPSAAYSIAFQQPWLTLSPRFVFISRSLSFSLCFLSLSLSSCLCHIYHISISLSLCYLFFISLYLSLYLFVLYFSLSLPLISLYYLCHCLTITFAPYLSI